MGTPGIHRQPRFSYLPLLGLLLANLLSNTAIAKYAPLGSLRLSYDPLPWIKSPSSTPNQYWHAVVNPYGPPSPTTSHEEGTEPQHVLHHHVLQPASQQQIVNIHERPPSEIIIEDEINTDHPDEISDAPIILERRQYEEQRNNIEKPNSIEEPLIAESKLLDSVFPVASNRSSLEARSLVKRATSPRYTKTRKNNKYIYQKRRKSTVAPDYYYDSYEDTTTTRRYKPKRRYRPTSRRPFDSYEYADNNYSDNYSDMYYDYGSYELTTRPKRRRTTTTQKTKKVTRNKYRKRQKVASLSDEYDDEYIDDSVSGNLLLRQGEGDRATTLPTAITNGTTITTTSATTVTTENATTTTAKNMTGYGKQSILTNIRR